MAGWWSVCVSLPLCYFLMFRGQWRHFAWARLLRKIARLELRLVATHPDGKGGLGFLAQYPNAYMFFVFGMSSLIAAALAKNLIQDSISMAAFSTVMAGWLAVVIVVFALPLSAFSPPLARLKQRALDWLGGSHRSDETFRDDAETFVGAGQPDRDCSGDGSWPPHLSRSPVQSG
jgi:hypothetical protein